MLTSLTLAYLSMSGEQGSSIRERALPPATDTAPTPVPAPESAAPPAPSSVPAPDTAPAPTQDVPAQPVEPPKQTQ
jgi:hypothetical protein